MFSLVLVPEMDEQMTKHQAANYRRETSVRRRDEMVNTPPAYFIEQLSK